jgi:hypothetical protein
MLDTSLREAGQRRFCFAGSWALPLVLLLLLPLCVRFIFTVTVVTVFTDMRYRCMDIYGYLDIC